MTRLADSVDAVMARKPSSMRADFVARVENEIALYRDTLAPAYSGAAGRREALERLHRAARQFVRAVTVLDGDARGVLAEVLAARLFARTHGDGTEPAEAKLVLDRVDTAAGVAGDIAEAAREMTNRPRSDVFEARAIDAFVDSVAHNYGVAFGELPRPTRGGRFARLLPAILDAAGIGASIGEDRLRRVLASSPFPYSGEPPRRGAPKKLRICD